MNPTLAGLIFFALLILAGSACSRHPKDLQAVAAEAEPLEVKVGENLFEPMSREFMEKFQPDIQMAAHWRGDHVWIAVLNRTDHVIQISAANFGLILDGKLHRLTRENALAQFPITNLQPGAAATGTIQFRKQGDLTGQRLVFYHEPETRPSMCIIKGLNSESSMAPATMAK